MKSKILVVLVGIFLIRFLVSCCEEGLDFYDYTEMVAIPSSTLIEAGQTLTINLDALNLEFVAATFGSWGLRRTQAHSCAYGEEGMKFPITQIEITSDNDFDNDHPANENLANLFRRQISKGNGDVELLPLEGDIQAQLITLSLQKRPTIDEDHTFIFRLTKSNGEEIVSVLDKVVWQ